jgi:hypothetical protein
MANRECNVPNLAGIRAETVKTYKRVLTAGVQPNLAVAHCNARAACATSATVRANHGALTRLSVDLWFLVTVKARVRVRALE